MGKSVISTEEREKQITHMNTIDLFLSNKFGLFSHTLETMHKIVLNLYLAYCYQMPQIHCCMYNRIHN